MQYAIETLAVTILTKYLGSYVNGLQRENLNVSIGSGDVVLENLELKKEALDDLELPITVRGGKCSLICTIPVRGCVHIYIVYMLLWFIGYMGKLRLKIPWKSLKTEPAVISIERVFLLASPKLHTEVRRIFL